MFAVTVLTALNTFNGGFLVASRFIYAAAREGNLPRAFAATEPQAVPWLAVMTLAGASAVIAAHRVRDRGQWLLLVAVGATIEAGDLRGRVVGACWRCGGEDLRERPFRLVARRPLAHVRPRLFALLAVARDSRTRRTRTGSPCCRSRSSPPSVRCRRATCCS